MLSPAQNDKTKVVAYFDVIENHVLRPIRSSDLRASCTAVLLMLFGAVDGLGKLIHPDEQAGSAKRSMYFLSKMGERYAQNNDALWRIRNSLVHNSVNTISFMSMTQMGKAHHLTRNRPDGLLFVSTSSFFEDFCEAFERAKTDVLADVTLLTRAAARLEWLEDDPQSYWGPLGTPPGPVNFVTIKKRQRSRRYITNTRELICRTLSGNGWTAPNWDEIRRDHQREFPTILNCHPGTLNVEMVTPSHYEPPDDGKWRRMALGRSRTCGFVKKYEGGHHISPLARVAAINGQGSLCWIYRPGNRPNVLELMSIIPLRTTYNLKDGEIVKLTVEEFEKPMPYMPQPPPSSR